MRGRTFESHRYDVGVTCSRTQTSNAHLLKSTECLKFAKECKHAFVGREMALLKSKLKNAKNELEEPGK